MKSILLALSLFSSAANADEFADPVARAKEVFKSESLHELNFIGRRMSRLIPLNGVIQYERYFLWNHADAALTIRHVTCRAWALSRAACAKAGEPVETAWNKAVDGDAADALRHFALAASLSCALNVRSAEEFLVAHEGDPSGWKADNLMDVHNNYVAFRWARERGNCRRSPALDSLARMAFEHLKAGRLRVLKKGKTECADTKNLPNLSEDLERRTEEFHALLRRKYPNLCGRPR